MVISKVCNSCGKVYEDQMHAKNICKECKEKLKIHKECPVCEKLFCVQPAYKKRKFCSKECRLSPKGVLITRKVREETSLRLFGVKNVFQNEEKKEKIKDTLQERYGVDHISKVESVKQKVGDKLEEKFGVRCAFQSKEIKEKSKETIKEKYGVEYISQSPIIQEAIRKTSLKKYGFENASKNPEIKKKREDTFLKKYGVRQIWMSQDIQAKCRETTFERFGSYSPWENGPLREKWTKEKRFNYWSIFLKFLNDKNIIPSFLIDEYMNEDLQVFEYFCKSCNKKFTAKTTVAQKVHCPNHKFRTLKEQQVKDFLTANKIEFVCNKSFSFERKRFELDIYIPELKLGIEFNGVFWHSELYRNKTYHLDKYLFFEKQDIKVIQIFENEWDFKQEIVKSIICEHIEKNAIISIDKCYIKTIENKAAKFFIQNNSLQDYEKSCVCFGVFNENELVHVFTTNIVFENIEINQECSKMGVKILNIYPKLIDAILQTHNSSVFKNIIRFANLRFPNQEKLYNFKLIGMLLPDFFYFKDKEVFSKKQLNKKKIKQIIKIEDKAKTIEENLLLNSCYRVYDCGKKVFAYNLGSGN